MEFLPIDFLDLVESGEAQVVLPTADTGPRSYGAGRLFLSTANLIPTMTADAAPSGVASASSVNTTYAAWKAFDHVNTAAGQDSWIPGEVTGYLQYQFPTARIIARYAITTRNYTGIYSPNAWTFEGSNDGSAWTTLNTQVSITDWAALQNERKVFDFANTTAYAYYRLDITASNHATLLAVGELEMMEASIASNLVFENLVAITSSGAVAAGTNVAYARNASGTNYGPVLVTPAAKSAGWQTIAAALWPDPVALFHTCDIGDLVIPLNGDSLGYRKVA